MDELIVTYQSGRLVVRDATIVEIPAAPSESVEAMNIASTYIATGVLDLSVLDFGVYQESA